MIGIKCDIILPVCDQFDFTKNCIDSMIANTDVPYRIIVINNGKNENTRSYLSEIKNRLGERLLVIQNDHNVGWVKALNQGFAISKAPFICFQNDDTIVTKGWLKKMIGILERDERVGLVNPTWEGKPNYLSVEDYGVLVEKKYSGKYIETDWARGFSVVLKRKVLDAIGGIDEIYGLAYFDDVDFSVRAINAGFLVVLALDTYVYHHRNVTFFQVLKGKTWNELHEKNKVIYYSKWGKPLKIVVILDRSNCKDETAFKKIRDTLYYLARRQHHIDVWSPCDVRAKIPHTNIEVKHYSFFFLTPAVLLDLYLNKWKKEEKKYNAIFGFNKRLADFGVNSVLFKGLLLYGPSGEKDFNDFIKDRADELREKSKEFYSAKV